MDTHTDVHLCRIGSLRRYFGDGKRNAGRTSHHVEETFRVSLKGIAVRTRARQALDFRDELGSACEIALDEQPVLQSVEEQKDMPDAV